MHNRRDILRLAAGAMLGAGMRAGAASNDFWDRKPPSEWSSDEIERLITHSPWAKQASAGSEGPGGGSGSGRHGGLRLPGGISFPGGGGMGGGRMGGGRMGGGGRGGGENRGGQYKGTVRWESAKPILDALKAPLPESFANHYVISVSGFPLLSGDWSGSSPESTQNTLDRLKELTSLQPKGKPLAQPGIVEEEPAVGGASFLFGFAKDILTFAPEDAEVDFSTHLGTLAIKAKFDLREMTYHGEMAI